jgi:hypothetical protein
LQNGFQIERGTNNVDDGESSFVLVGCGPDGGNDEETKLDGGIFYLA